MGSDRLEFSGLVHKYSSCDAQGLSQDLEMHGCPKLATVNVLGIQSFPSQTTIYSDLNHKHVCIY